MQQQNRNLILFVTLSSLVIVGYMLLKQWLTPPAPEQPQQQTVKPSTKPPDPRTLATLQVGLAGTADPGASGYVRLGGSIAPTITPSRPKHDYFAANLVASLAGLETGPGGA